MPKESEFVLKKIPKDVYDENGSMDLNSCYEQTVAELGLQQSKRDQIIAFYLTILSFAIPSVIGLEINDVGKAIAFFAMYVIGVMFCHVILRYRIYKEVYWIACRVLTQMANLKPAGRNRENIYALFLHSLTDNAGTIVQKTDAGKISFWRSYRRQLNSAETLLFETLVLFSSFVGGIGAVYLYGISKVGCVAGLVAVAGMLIMMNYKYTSRLMELYVCVETGLKKDLKKTFDKAWMLHCFVDDMLEEQNEK